MLRSLLALCRPCPRPYPAPLGPTNPPVAQDLEVRLACSVNANTGQGAQVLRAPHVTLGRDGNYVLRVLGRAGEPVASAPVQLDLTHAYCHPGNCPIQATLATGG